MCQIILSLCLLVLLLLATKGAESGTGTGTGHLSPRRQHATGHVYVQPAPGETVISHSTRGSLVQDDKYSAVLQIHCIILVDYVVNLLVSSVVICNLSRRSPEYKGGVMHCYTDIWPILLLQKTASSLPLYGHVRNIKGEMIRQLLLSRDP